MIYRNDLKTPPVSEALIDYLKELYNLDYVLTKARLNTSDYAIGYGNAVADIVHNFENILKEDSRLV